MRGVSADRALRTLLDRKLIREAGRKPVPGRPIIYETTADFLHYFGLNSLDEMPPLRRSPSTQKPSASTLSCTKSKPRLG